MDLSPQTLSIFGTLILVLAAMCVALIVDLLKGNNEQLRELAIELKAKKDAAERNLHTLELHTATLLQQPGLLTAGAAPATAPEAGGASLLNETSRPEATIRNTGGIKTAEASAPSAAAKTVEYAFQKAVRKERDDLEPKREMSAAVAAVAESVTARMSGGSRKTSTAVVDVDVDSGSGASLAPVEVRTGTFKSGSELRKDWGRILTTKKQDSGDGEAVVVSGGAAGDVVDTEGTDGNLIQIDAGRGTASALPEGFHDYAVLRKAAEGDLRMQGMVVSIGANPLDRAQSEEVSKFVRGLLQGGDFGCQPDTDEYLLVCSGDARQSQHRLSQIAEKLWEFQLSALGRLNVQFAWGGMEARPIDRFNDVVAAAIEQMSESRRVRRGAGAVSRTVAKAV
jgi:hypothetical protein